MARPARPFPVLRFHAHSGKWTYYRDGQRRTLTRDRQESERMLRAVVMAADGQTASPIMPGEGGHLLSEIAAIYMREAVPRLERRSAVRACYVLGVAVDMFGAMPADRFRVREVEQLTARFTATKSTSRKTGKRDGPPLSYQYVRKLLAAVRQWIRWSAMRDLVSAESCAKVCLAVRHAKPESPRRPQAVPVPPADFRATMEKCSPEVRAMATLQLLTGMRTGELLGISLAEIDRSRPMWVYRPARHKNASKGKGRSIYLDAECQALLAPWIDRTPIFGLTLSGYDQHLKRAAKRAGVTPWRAYANRHARATEAAIESGDEAARLILGHSSKRILSIYTHTAEDEKHRRAG